MMRKILFTFVDDNEINHLLYEDDGDRHWYPPLDPADVKFAEMLAAHAPPRCMTDDVFLAGLRPIDEQMGPTHMAIFKQKMAEQGVPLTGSEHYLPSLASKFADPAALVSHGQGRGHIKKVAEERNLSVDGAVSNQRHEPESDPWQPKTKLSKRITQRKMQQHRAANTDESRKLSDNELREMVVAKHGKQD